MGLRPSLALLRRRHDLRLPEISVQHGLVELHFPARSVEITSLKPTQASIADQNTAVFVLSTIQLGKELESSFFKVLGTVSSLHYLRVNWIYTDPISRSCPSSSSFFGSSSQSAPSRTPLQERLSTHPVYIQT